MPLTIDPRKVPDVDRRAKLYFILSMAQFWFVVSLVLGFLMFIYFIVFF